MCNFLSPIWISAKYFCNAKYQVQVSTNTKYLVYSLYGEKPLAEPMLTYCEIDFKKQTSAEPEWKCESFSSRKCIWKYSKQCNMLTIVIRGLIQYKDVILPLTRIWIPTVEIRWSYDHLISTMEFPTVVTKTYFHSIRAQVSMC